MAEIKSMNLVPVQYDPLRGIPKQESLAENLRKASERKFMRKMSEYQIRKLKRDEKDYAINKRAENFIFSNYPSSKAKGDFTTAFDDRKFGPGSREVQLAKWKEKVGGNYGLFQQWYEQGKKAEEQALYKSFTRNPAKYKSDKAYRTAISDWMNSMSDVEQQEILNNAPAEVLQVINENWNMSNPTFIESLQKIPQNLTFGTGPDDDSIIPELVATASGLGLAGYGLMRGNVNMGKRGLDMTKRNIGKLTDSSADYFKQQAKVMQKTQPLVDAAGGKINRMDDLKKFVAGDSIPHKDLNKMQPALVKMVKSGELNRMDANKFKNIVDDLMRSGKEITSESIGQAIKEGGSQYDSLAKSLARSTRLSIGPVKTLGLKRTLLGSIGLGVGATALAKQMGVNEQKAEDIGMVAGSAPATINPFMVNRIRKVIQDKGAGYIMKKIASRGGMRLLGSVAAKTLLGGTGIGMAIAVPALAYDLKLIYDILADEYEE